MKVRPVELNDPPPRYYQVYASLLERILVSDYQVSRITIVW